MQSRLHMQAGITVHAGYKDGRKDWIGVHTLQVSHERGVSRRDSKGRTDRGKGQVERGRREKANRTSQLNLILTLI
jgi:hypothetical protein